MPKLVMVKHLKISSAKLRAMLHEAWKAGNDSYNNYTEELGEKEKREHVVGALVKEGFAHWEEEDAQKGSN